MSSSFEDRKRAHDEQKRAIQERYEDAGVSRKKAEDLAKRETERAVNKLEREAWGD